MITQNFIYYLFRSDYEIKYTQYDIIILIILVPTRDILLKKINAVMMKLYSVRRNLREIYYNYC